MKSILPEYIINIWDHYQIANAYLNKLVPDTNFMGGFNMMVVAGAFDKKAEPTEPKDILIDTLKYTIIKLEQSLLLALNNFVCAELNNITVDYKLVMWSDTWQPSIYFSDDILYKIINDFGELRTTQVPHFTVTSFDKKVLFQFNDRQSLIKYVKDKNIIINAFGKQWQP